LTEIKYKRFAKVHLYFIYGQADNCLRIAIMVHWARIILVLFALAAALGSATTGGALAKASHPCVDMMMDDCPGTDDDSGCLDPCCTPVGPSIPLPFLDHAVIAEPASTIAKAIPPANDRKTSGLRSLPDLRPPIA